MNTARLIATLLIALFPLQALAQAYPSKAIRIVVPVATGGIADYYSRVIGAKLLESWGQAVVVENRPGNDGNIAVGAFVSAQDDHTADNENESTLRSLGME